MNSDRPKIILTGGTGYIGSHILLKLRQLSYDVIVIDDFSNSSPKTWEDIQEFTGESISLIEGSVCDADVLDQCCSDFFGATVIHCAGLKSPSESETEPLKYYSENVGGAINLISAMEKNGCKKLIFSSSASVYGDTDQVPVDESSLPSPKSVYAKTKYMVEQICEDWSKASEDRSCVSLRYFNPIGADDSGVIGEKPKQIVNNLMPHILTAATGVTQGVTIFGSDYDTRDGTGERDYIHVVDLAEAHIKSLEYIETSKGYENINIGTGSGVTVLELIHEFEKATSVKVPHTFSNRRIGDIDRSIASVEKAKRKLNWEAKFDVAEMCRSAWQWHRSLA